MPTNTKLRTPILKPRHQGGTFYTFSSALEDIGLNINERSNKVRLSYYVLLDIPNFSKEILNTKGNYDASTSDVSTFAGDYTFAEWFQDYVQNAETVIRNQSMYNYASNKTVSERVFWKALFKSFDSSIEQIPDTNYYTIPNIIKGYGRISAGSQRTDSYGLYNETFVQIPSSYGQMQAFFKRVTDENYRIGDPYYSTNNDIIEGIPSSEYDDNKNLIATSISAKGIFDGSTAEGNYYDVSSNISTDSIEMILELNELRSIYSEIDTEQQYNYDTLTYDDIGFGNVYKGDDYPNNFNFNAILVYYTIYNDANNVDNLATNLYGIYILDNALETTFDPSTNNTQSYYFPSLNKIKATPDRSGTSFAFRINAKPTSAYNGDITISDNSTESYQMSENFNDVIRNLSNIMNSLREYMGILQRIVTDNTQITNMTTDAISRINELEGAINTINTTYKKPYYIENFFDTNITIDECNDILNKIVITRNTENNDIGIKIETDNTLTENESNIIRKLSLLNNDSKYYDLGVIIMLMLEKLKHIQIQ